MRHFLWVSIGFALVCGLRAYLGLPGWLWVPVLGLAGLCVLLGSRGKGFQRSALVLLGVLLGWGWFSLFQARYAAPSLALDGVEREITVTVSTYPEPTDYGCVAEGKLYWEGKHYGIRFWLNEARELQPGDALTGTFRLKGTLPGGAEPSAYFAGRGIAFLGFQKGETSQLPGAENGLIHRAARLARHIKDVLEEAFPEDVAAFAKALLLGDTSGLDYGTVTDLRVSGIYHVVSVSGLHVSILYGLITTLTLRRRFLSALAGMPALLAFAALAGFSPSVSRACLMCGLMLLAQVLDREYDPPTALAFAVGAMLLRNPMTAANVGFQLSVASVAGILLLSPGIRRWLEELLSPGKLPRKLGSALAASVSVTLGATLVTTPLSAFYFGTVSLMGMVNNLLTLWLVNLSFYGILAVGALSALWPAGAGLLGWLLAWPIRLVLAVSHLTAAFPLAAVYTSSGYVTAWLVFVYVLLGVFLLEKRKQPGLLTLFAALGLCLAVLASWTEPLLDDTRLTVLDVGQGQSILLQSQGKTFLIDCGGDSDTSAADAAAETLLSQGISRVDGILLTHLDRDHAGGLEHLLSRVSTELLLIPAGTQYPGGQQVWQTAVLRFGEAKITVYPPVLPGPGNENSLCILFESETCAILVTGDRSGYGERMLLREGDLPQVDVLIAGHHGSRNSVCRELLEALQPETVIISVGEGNPFGHPAPETLQRLEEFGCAVYRTDQHGTICFRR